MKRAWIALVLGAWCATFASCTSGLGLGAPRAMNRPIDVAFACFDTSIPGAPMVRPLADCAMFVDVTTNTRMPPSLASAEAGDNSSPLHMHALVTQSTRGEVAAVDLIAHTVLDSDQSVPGYTFVQVGELPTRIVVPPHDPTCTYVASRGPVDGRSPGISIIDTRSFRSAAGTNNDRFAPYPLPTAPSDMVLAPDESGLWLTLDELGVVVHVPIVGRCTLGPIDRTVALINDTLPAHVAQFDPMVSSDLTRVCPTGPVTFPPQIVTPPRAIPLDGSAHPRPVAIAIDDANGLLLVADRAWPMIHRIHMSDGTFASALATGVPVRDVVVTPRVPDSYDLVRDPVTCSTAQFHRPNGLTPVPTSQVTFSRYVYAIDDTDGTVLAIEYSDGTDGTTARSDFGAVIDVDVEGSARPDRLAIPFVARTLEVITPQFDTEAADPRFRTEDADPCAPVSDHAVRDIRYGYGLCTPSDPAPVVEPSTLTLRGVFLVVATDDGAVRLVDVYDLDAPCRGRTFGTTDPTVLGMDCVNPTVTGDEVLYVRRHRPRSQNLLTSFVTLTTPPTVFFPNGGSEVLGNDGMTMGAIGMGTSSVPWLAGVTCDAVLPVVWPDPTMDTQHQVVCSVVDPFAAVAETWSAVWQGSIPATYTTSANARQVTGGDWVFETRVDYCAAGAIGSAEAVASVPPPTTMGWGVEVSERLYPQGDVLAITNVLSDAQANDAGCRAVVGIAQLGQPQQAILLPFTHAYSLTPPDISEPYSGRLVVDAHAHVLDRGAGFAIGPCNAACGSQPDHQDDLCDATGTSCMHVPTVTDVIDCFQIGSQGSLLTVDVRSQGAYTVTGSHSGFFTRVHRGATGACEYDAARTDPRTFSHAFHGQPYRNPRIAFTPQIGPGQVPPDLTEIRMVLSGGPAQLGLDLSQASFGGARGIALPSHLRYSPEMWALYAIETERRGLVEMTMRPLAPTQVAYQ